MVNVEKLNGMLRNLSAYTGQLQEIACTERSAFLADKTAVGGAKYYLQIAIETCINIGTYIISSEGYRAPRDYRDVFTVLLEQGILPDDLANSMRQMAGLRNRLVHLYWEVDDELIYDYLLNNLGDFERFVACVVKLL